MIIASREDIDLHGNKWEERVVWMGDGAFRVEVRSDDPCGCLSAELNLLELSEYIQKTAAPPFVWRVLL